MLLFFVFIFSTILGSFLNILSDILTNFDTKTLKLKRNHDFTVDFNFNMEKDDKHDKNYFLKDNNNQKKNYVVLKSPKIKIERRRIRREGLN